MHDPDLPSLYLLMATRDRTGKPMGWHQIGFGGSVLMELALQGAVSMQGKRVHAGPVPPEDELLRLVWDDVRTDKPRAASTWVNRLSGGRYRLLRRQWSARLVEAGLLRHQRVKVLGLFPRDLYPSNGTGREDAVRHRILRAVRDGRGEPRLLCLVALLYAADGLAEVTADRAERRRIKGQAKAWMKEDRWAKAVGEVVAAITASIVAASVIAASASS
ncbi:MAG: GOLPH3/VPS74 family protein [Thermoplasmatota archaeon]